MVERSQGGQGFAVSSHARGRRIHGTEPDACRIQRKTTSSPQHRCFTQPAHVNAAGGGCFVPSSYHHTEELETNQQHRTSRKTTMVSSSSSSLLSGAFRRNKPATLLLLLALLLGVLSYVATAQETEVSDDGKERPFVGGPAMLGLRFTHGNHCTMMFSPR